MPGLPPRPLRLLAMALVAAGLTATVARATLPEAPVRLVSPAEGAVLAAESTATLEWAPLDGHDDLDGPAGVGRWEEWEAFLSLDGGRTYPVRVTPHLDRDLTRVSFRVPGFPTANARLLLRVGDERRETAYELPQRFAILAAPLGNALDLERTVGRRGEPARPGEPGVLVWVEGSRRGGGWRQVAAAEPARAVPGLSFPAAVTAPEAQLSAPPPSGAPLVDTGAPCQFPPLPTGTARNARSPRPETADLLLLLKRQNE
ncbi:MAG TPA: hypothetical protein VFE33_10110 [Thermoanaerobaculia bacterium]|nr:hypothetical protein [Thermoanaerobaculia bacterium]